MLKSISSVHLDFAARWEVDGQVHYRYRVPSCQLLLVETGRLWTTSAGRRLSAGPGDVLCIQRLPVNEYGWDGPTTFWEAHLTVPDGLRFEQQPPPPILSMGVYAAEARTVWDTWCREVHQPGDTAQLRVQAATYRLLAAMSAALARTPTRSTPDRWQRVRARLERDVGRPLVLEDLARTAGVSPDHLIRGFRRAYGMSPMAWRARAGLRQACAMLMAGQAVKAIAAKVGFRDASSFTRAFRQHFGLTPTAFVAQDQPPQSFETEAGDYPFNRHLMPPGSSSPLFLWG